MHKKHLKIALLLITANVSFGGVLKQSGDMVLEDLLTSISCNSITCPVKITAKSNIKTNQRASWVGLGFDLNVPYIERVAVGSADEKSNTPFYLDRLANNNDCFQPGVFDKNKIWEPLLKPNANGYQGNYVVQMTCPGTDFATGYKTEMNDNFQSMLGGNCNIAFTVNDAGEIMATTGFPFTIGTTNRPAGAYSAGTLCTWLGTNCTNPTIQGVKQRDDFKYNDQQDFFFLNAFFGSGRIVFKNPSYQSITLSSGKTFKVYNKAEVLVPYIQNYRNFIISFEYNTPSNGADPDIIKWTIKDENGTEYVFDKTVMRYNANPANLNERLYESVNSQYTNGQLTHLVYNDQPQPEYPLDERPGYPNKNYVMRWYLTMIKGSNYSETNGVRKGNWIEFEYSESSNYQQQKDMYHSLLENMVQRQYWPLVGVSKIKSPTSSDNYITAIYSSSNFYFKPVYPYKVRSPFEEIEFQKSAAIDLNDNGDQQLDAIVKRVKIDGSYQLKQKIHFYYDSKGHAIGHPYSKTSAKGLTKLREIAIEDRNGNLQPYMKFFYVSNPDFQRAGSPYTGYFTHDFYGYYSSLPTTGLKNPFLNFDGHSSIDAAAWSIKRIVYGNGKIVEYEYEPNEINAFTTGETTPLLFGPGIRVAREKVYSGSGDSLTTTYKYGLGFTGFNMALASFMKGVQPANYLGEIYLLLNYGQLWTNMHNVLLLSGNSVLYGQCEAHTLTGYERTQFLSPNDFLREYGGDRVISLADDKYGKNSKGNYRGAVKRVEIFKNGNQENPVYSKLYTYEIKHDYQAYIMPYLDIKADFVACRDRVIGTPSQIGDPPSFPDEDIRDLQDSTFIGYLRNVNTYEIRDGISAKEEYTYDVVSGSVKKTRKCNSDRSCLESEKIFAHEISDYSWMIAKNMLMQTAGIKMWLSNPSHNSGTPEIIGSSSNTWSQAYGGYSDQGYVWNVKMEQDGFPTTLYSAFNYTSKSGVNWKRKANITKIDDFQRVLEAGGLNNNEYHSIIYRQDIGLPMAEIANGQYDNSVIFTGDYDLNDVLNSTYFDYPNHWEKGLVPGVGHVSEISPDKPHFGLKSLHVKNTYGPTRNVAIDRAKKYIFSAWVFPVTSTKYIRFAVELRDQNNVIQARKDFVKEKPTVNQWQLVEHQFDLSDVAIEKIDGTADYFRIWVGNGEVETYYDGLGYARPDFYIDDIRFYPGDAMVTTTYYDPFAGKPVTQVDVNSKCQGIVEYDGFGNVKKSFKRNQDGTIVNYSENNYDLQNSLSSHDIHILSPNGGESIKRGIAVPIKWISGSDVTAVDIMVTVDNGTNWTALTTGILRDGNSFWGNYLWVPIVGAGTQCKIKVKETNGSGVDNSDNNFSIVNPDPSIASAPSPADNAIDQSYRPTLSWSGSNSGTVKYDVYFSTVTPPQKRIAEGITTTSFILPNDLISNNTYYWQIVTTNATGVTPGPVWKFSTKTGSLPYAVLKEPKHATLCGLLPALVTLSWDGDADNYEVFYWEEGDAEPVAPQISTPNKTIDITNLTNNKVYYWKIRSTRPNYIPHMSETWGFRVFETAGQTAPSKPVNLTGSRLSEYQVKLQWSGGEDANNDLIFYRVFFFVEMPEITPTGLKIYLSNVTKSEECLDCNDWENHYKDVLRSYTWERRYNSQANAPAPRRKTRQSCYLYADVVDKEITLPRVTSLERVHFYVQAINHCNRNLVNESELVHIN